MDRRRAAGALLALAACIACSTAAPMASNQTALNLYEGPSEGCYYNFQHYGEGDRIMTNEPCLNCTCHNRMLMCYLKVCPFTKPIGQDCTIEKRADQCCPIVTCPDVPVDLLTSTSTTSPAEYGATGLGKVDKYGCSINGKYFPEGSKVPPAPNKPCEHCYCIRNMTTCVMQECTLHVDGCTPIYHKDVCCPVRYSCDHLEDEMLLLDDMTTTVRPTPGFLLTTTTVPSVTQTSQNCVHDDQVFADGALIKTEIACEHCYCMKGDIVCVVQECGTPMENEGKNCTSLPPRHGQCCPDTYICEGDELLTEPTTSVTYEELTTLSPPRRVEGSGYRNEPDEPYTEIPTFEGSGEEHATTLDSVDMFTSQKQTPQIIDEMFAPTEESQKPSLTTVEPDKEQNTVPDESNENSAGFELPGKTTLAEEPTVTAQPAVDNTKKSDTIESKTTISDYSPPSDADTYTSKDDEFIITTVSPSHHTTQESDVVTEMKPATEITESLNIIGEVTSQESHTEPSISEASIAYQEDDKTTIKLDETSLLEATTQVVPKESTEDKVPEDEVTTLAHDNEDKETLLTTTESISESMSETTSINPVENEIDEDILPPGRIPGEGDCLLNGITYKNGTNVPNINNCHSSCKCVSSIVKCDPIICSPPPVHMDNMNDCQPIYDTPDACCPTYVCHSRETIPPESHSQMSGTESPKPSIESECQGEQCQSHETKPTSSELCKSGSCETAIKDQEKECKDGACEYPEPSINTDSHPVKHPEHCVGENCLPSEDACINGKCQSSSETICDSENGCQPSEVCEGNNCVDGSKAPVATDDLPICEGSQCATPSKETQTPNENIMPLECIDESCKRDEQSQENMSPSACSGSSCSTLVEEQDKSEASTTESTIKDVTYKESTTEIIKEAYSKSPQSDETSSDETQKDISSEHSTERSEDTMKDVIQTATEKGEFSTGTSETHTPKTEETVSEMYNTPDTQEYETAIPDVYTTQSKEQQVTETIEQVTKEIDTATFTTQNDEHLPDLTKEEDMPTKTFEATTETLDTAGQDHKENKDDATDINIIEHHTESQEISTKPTNILATTTKVSETDITDQEVTSKQEMITELPEYSTRSDDGLPPATEEPVQTTIKPQDSINTESQSDILITESPEGDDKIPEVSTEKHVDMQINDDDITYTKVHDAVTLMPVQVITEQSIQESSEPNEIEIGETDTNKMDNEIEKDHLSTESPIVFTEVVSSETTVDDLHKLEKDTESPQITEEESLPVTADTSKMTTASSVKEQDDLSKPTEIYNVATEIVDTYTTPTDTEYVTSVSSTIHDTQFSTPDENLGTQTHYVPMTQEGESKLPESSIKEMYTSTIPQDLKEITTLQPEIPVTHIQEKTTDVSDVHDIPTDNVPDTLEEHTDTPIKHPHEVSSIAPEETFQDDTIQKESPHMEQQDKDTTSTTLMDELEITPKPGSMAELPTTISSVLSEKDQEITTKYVDVISDAESSEESSSLPEVHSTKAEESTMPTESDKKTSGLSTSSGLETEDDVTEPSQQPNQDITEIPDLTQNYSQTPEPSIDERTVAPAVSYTDSYTDSDDKTISVSIDEGKMDEKLPYTTPESVNQFTEMLDILTTDDHKAEGIDNENKDIDSTIDEHKPTEYTVTNDMESQTLVTQPSESITQSSSTEPKLTTELDTDEESVSTPSHIKEKEQTEAPLSLVTESAEVIRSEDADDSIKDKTTQIPQERVPDEEDIKIPEQSDTHPEIPVTESPELPVTEGKLDTETSSQSYSETERQPDSSGISSKPEYTTSKIVDIDDTDKAHPSSTNTYSDVSTESGEKAVPTTEYQEAIYTQTSDKTDSDLYPTDVSQEFTPGSPVTLSSQESLSNEDQELSTKYPETSSSMSTVGYDHEPDTKPENIPVQEHTDEAATEQPLNKVDFITEGSTTSETLKDDHDNTQQGYDKVDIHENEPTILPDLLTTKYPVTLDKQIEDSEPGKPEVILTSEHDITTERVIYTEQTTLPETQSSEENKFTQVFQTSEEKTVTTPAYQDLTTLTQESMTDAPESHSSPTDISMTESSDISPSEENNRRTLSPISQTSQSEQYTTEKEKITELPEITKTQEMGQADDLQQTTTSDKESTTLISISPMLSSTEGNIPLKTETVPPYEDQKLPTVTEKTEKYSTETLEGTLKPETDPNVIEEVQTEQSLPSLTEMDTVTDKTTVEDDLIKIPVDTAPVEIPLEQTVAQESQTESALSAETATSEIPESDSSVPSESTTDMSEPIKPEISPESSTLRETETVPKATETSIPKETDVSISEVTEASVSEETVPSLHEVPEDSVFEVTEISYPEIPDGTKVSQTEVTEATVPEVTKASISEITETPIAIVTETSSVEVTEGKIPDISVDDVSEPLAVEVTEASSVKISEASVADITEFTAPEVTEASAEKITSATDKSEPSATDVTGPSVPEVTETSAPKITEVSSVDKIEPSATDVTAPSADVITEAPAAEITEASAVEITESSAADITEGAKITESPVPEQTDTSMDKETENGITYKPHDQELESTNESSPTSEPMHASSETTPYLVELQEHTTKIDEDIMSFTEEDRTRTPDTYQTERGDQPLDNIPDKFTPEDFHGEHTTKESFTKKDEQSTTLPPDQPSEYTERIPDKTELPIEGVSISSESPVPTVSNAEIITQTSSSEEQTVTISPTVSVPYKEQEKLTTVGYDSEITTDKKDVPFVSEKIPEHEIMHETTSSGDTSIPVVAITTTKTQEESTTHLPVVDNKFTEPEDRPSESYSPTITPELPKPGLNEIQPAEEAPSPDFPPSGSSGYGQEPDYVEEDQAFGPGTCRYGGKVYVSAQQIPRDDPCDFCFCFRSDIICLQQSCPPPIHGCHEEPIQGFCCPRYECPVSMATTLNVTTTTTTTTTTLPPHFLPHAYKGAAQRRGCQIKGHSYKVGEVVRASSGPCLHCTCGGDGQMKCDPKACTPEPMLRQMIAAAVSAKRRR